MRRRSLGRGHVRSPGPALGRAAAGEGMEARNRATVAPQPAPQTKGAASVRKHQEVSTAARVDGELTRGVDEGFAEDIGGRPGFAAYEFMDGSAPRPARQIAPR